jgi:hypothetical protein
LRKGGGSAQTHYDREATYKKHARERSIHSHLQHPKIVNKNYNAPQTNESDGALCKAGKLNALEKQSAVGAAKTKIVF